jgi:hypothetical protein
LTAPSRTTVEITLIGPGYGEAIALHLGDGQWVTIDSCVRRLANGVEQNATLAYFSEIGVDPATQVIANIATHWHNDHVAGLADLVAACNKALFCCAAAFREDDFIEFAEINAAPDPSAVTRRTSEITAVFKLLADHRRPAKFLTTDTFILNSGSAKVWALSPSHFRLEQFLRRVGGAMPKVKTPMAWIGDLKPNDIAVVTAIEFSDCLLIFGADLEEVPGRGWTRLLEEVQCLRPGTAAVFKVPHHGSETGHCLEVWQQRIAGSGISILTPFGRGRKPLPTSEDVARILSFTPKAYSSARLASIAPIKRDPSVERIIREGGLKIRGSEPKAGQLRLRREIGGALDWNVELIGNAVRLAEVHG